MNIFFQPLPKGRTKKKYTLTYLPKIVYKQKTVGPRESFNN